MAIFILQSGGGGGISGIDVLDEGVSVNLSAKKLNFIGDNVIALQDSLDPYQVNIYDPSVAFAPFYNLGTAIVSDWATTSRNVASPTFSFYNIGDWTGGTSHSCFKDTTIIYSSNYFRMDNNTSSFTAIVYDANGTTTLATKTVTLNGNQDTTSDNIRIVITGFATEYGKYKCQSTVYFNINSILPNGGRISIEIKHINLTGTYTKTQNNIFYDSQTYTQTISGVAIAQNVLSSNKYLSGIRYYDLNDTFTISIADLDYLNSNSYPTNFISLNPYTNFGIATANLTGANLTGWNTNYDNQNATYSGSSYSITRPSFRYIGTAGTISAQVQDWVAGATATSSNMSVCIDTWTQESSYLSEYFTDEFYRVKSNYTSWDSTQPINSYDDNKGLIVHTGKLMTARTNWKTYYPALTSNPDYSGFSGWGTYYRKFTDASSLVRGSCQMSITGFTLQNLIDEDVKMWIYIPGRFTSECYVHGASTFDFGTFNGDNDPIRTSDSTTNTIKMSFGALGLDSTNNYFIMHLEITNSSIQPDSVVVSF